jgi:hypothetical protein
MNSQNCIINNSKIVGSAYFNMTLTVHGMELSLPFFDMFELLRIEIITY